MWRRWVGLVIGAALGYSGGAGLAARSLAKFFGDDPSGQASVRFAAVVVVGPVLALVGALVGYQRGRAADSSRRGL